METTGRGLQIMDFMQQETYTVIPPARSFNNNRRAAQRRRQVMRMKRLIRNSFFTLCAVILLAVSINAISAQATTKEESLTHTYKYYKSVEISKGDSLWTIAEAYTDGSAEAIQDCVKEMRSINSLKNDTIKAGDRIIVPYYSNKFIK